MGDDFSDFEHAVQDALDSLPADLRSRMSNVEVLVEDEPAAGQPLLGLYQGVPLTRRGTGYSGALPDKITVYRRPLLAACNTQRELRDEIRLTVLHEIGHYFGIEDADLPF